MFFGFTKGSAHPGIGIVEDSEGSIYYTDLIHVWKIFPDGRKKKVVENVHTHVLFIDKYDNLYGSDERYSGEATDKWYYYIWCLKKNGEFLKVLPEQEGYPENDRLVRDAFGNEFWPEKQGDYEVLKKSLAGGNSVDACDYIFDDIRWLSLSKDREDLYIIDRLKLLKLDAKKQLTSISENLKLASPPFEGVGDHHYVMGAWTDQIGNVFVAVFGAQKVQMFDLSGKEKLFYESDADWSPSGGFFRDDGSHFILEFSRSNTVRVVKVDPKGKRSVL